MALFNETPLSQIVREQSLGQPDPNLRQYTPDLGATAFRRGVDQSLGLGADYLGALAESAGQQPLAQDLYGYSDDQMRQAQRQIAGPQTTEEIHGLGSAFDFATNKALESLPVSATALGAGVLARNLSVPGRIASAAAPVFPVLAGETSYAIRQDPASTATPQERALAATGAGVASSALEVLPELGALSALARPAISNSARTMADAVLRGTRTAGTAVAGEALTEGAQDVVSRAAQSQFNPDIGVNPITDPEARQSFIESAAAGAAGGALFGAPAGVATTLRNLPEVQTPELPEGEQLRQFIGNMLTPGAERIPPSEIPANMDEAVAQEMQREQTLTERTQAIRDSLLQRDDLTEEEIATLQQEVDLDPDAQEQVLDVQQRKAREDAILESLSRLQPEQGRPSRVAPLIPLEEVDSIVQQAGIQEDAASPLVRRWLATYRPQFESGAVSDAAIDDAVNIFGERGYSVLRVMAGDNQAAQDAISANQNEKGQLDNLLFQALKPEYRETIRPNQLRQLSNMVRGAVQRGEGNLTEILETAFQNPEEVLASLDTLERNIARGTAAERVQDEDGEDVEFGDTQSVQDVEQRYFGDTTRNRRIKTGGLNIPWPMSRDEFAKIVEVAQNARGLAPESDVSEVPAVATLRRLGVDPADVAAEMGVPTEQLRNMVFLEGTAARPVDTAKGYISTLRTNTLERLNNTPRDPSAGSYLGMKTGNNRKAAMDVRRMVSGRVFGKRTPSALLQAFSDGVSLALSEGYKLDGPIPDSLVLARYGRGSDQVTVTLGEAKKAVGSRAPSGAEGNFPLGPESYNTLQENGYDPRVDFETGELFVPRRDIVEIVERYAAALAYRNAAQRGSQIPSWTQGLIDKHGTDFPSDFGRLSDPISLISMMVQWAAGETSISSRALNALLRTTPDRASEVEARRAREDERQGPAMGGGTSSRTTLDELSGNLSVLGKDTFTALGATTLKEAEKRRREAQSAARRRDERNLEVDPTELQAELGMSELDQESLAPQLLEAAGGVQPITPQHPYSVRGGQQADFFSTIRAAVSAHNQQFWSTGDLPSGINLQGPYAVLGKLAAKGQPLQVVVAKRQGTEMTEDMQRLVEAYTRRGFNVRTENTMNDGVPVGDSPYSQRVMARVMGVTGDNPAHVVMTVGESQAAALARRIGIPVIDLTNPVQQKIAGDILRSYDRGRRQDISRSNDPEKVKAFKRKGEERSGTQRARDILEVGIEKALASNWNNPPMVQRLERVMALAGRVDDQFFEAGLAARDPIALASTIDALETYERQYNAETDKPSLTRTAKKAASEARLEKARKYLDRVLNPEVRVLVRRMTDMTGLYSERELSDGTIDKLIEISSFSPDPLSTAFHESMHALIASMRGEPQQSQFLKVLLKAADAPLVISQLRALLKNEPAALQQVANDPEERIAYMYEFWAAGKLNLSPSVENWFIKLVNTIRGLLGMMTNEQKANLYLSMFLTGEFREPSAVNRVVMESMSTPERALRAIPLAQASERIVRKVIETAHGRLKSYGNPALSRIADAFYADSKIGGQRSGYLQTTRDVVNMYGSQFNEIMRGSTAESVDDLATALHTNTRPQDPEQAQRYDDIKRLMRRLFNYLRDSGVPLKKVEDYFPQAWDKAAIEDDKDGFTRMLVENAQYRDEEGNLQAFTPSSAAVTAEVLIGGSGRYDLQEDLAGFSPFMEASNTRDIILQDRAAAAEYLDHDIVKVVTRYITQAAKRGEYTRHFGDRGELLKGWLRQAEEYGMSQEELQRDIAPAIQAMEGTLGHDISPYARDFMSGVMTVLNLAVLPLAVFSSLIDPMGIVVRGGTVEEAWSAFKAGVRNIPESVKKNGKKLDIQEFAESVGTVESQFTVDMLGDMYGSAYMSDWARKANNLMFRYNLMEGWNTAMRSSATVAALNFIKRHAASNDKDSKRYLDELGLDKSMMVFDRQGNLLWKQSDIAARLLETGGDVSRAQDISRHTREGITRWVDGAVLRPHAAHRPAWASDPHFMLIWHLKQFTYSFHKTILERVIHEVRNGNYSPMITLASYVPFMIAADFLRGLVQGAGEEPPWRENMTFGETVWEGVQRSGMLGIRQFAVDGAENPAFALGPTANYAIDFAMKTADGQVEDALIKALPGNALWKGW